MDKQWTGISVIMPTYNQGCFISRAIASLQLQTFQAWELIIINDGSLDYTKDVVEEYLKDQRIKFIDHLQNAGLGKRLNEGIELSTYDLIAYLPSDDIYYSNHLEALLESMQNNENAILAYSGARFNYHDGPGQSYSETSMGKIDSFLQLVQVLHKKTNDRWIEREELVTDDLEKMFWSKLAPQGDFVPTEIISCEWVNHPAQRHKMIRENLGGGIHSYRQFYNIKQLLRYQSTSGSYINEFEDFKQFKRSRPDTEEKNRLKILLVGELCFNAERIIAFEEQGHKLYGLWMHFPDFYNTTGPLPFGNVEDIPYDSWVERVKEIQPDIIYAMLSHQAVKFAHEILLNNPGIPFVWHFKEGPFWCRQEGTWKELVELYVQSDGQIYLNPEMKSWFNQFISQEESCVFVLDGELPKKEWFSNQRSTLLSESVGDIHTVVPGRPFGLHPFYMKELAEQKIHLHMYGNFYSSVYKDWINSVNRITPGYLHVHPTCSPNNWVKELSQYDAGWLHCFESENNGEIMKATWNDLNYPARIPTLAAAGLPMLQKDNSGHIVATQSLIKDLGMGIFFKSFKELGKKLRDKEILNNVRTNVWKNRMVFTFDSHVDDLVNFFCKVINHKKASKQAEKLTGMEI